MSLQNAGELEVSDRNTISLENLSYALIGHPIQFPNCPHAQSLFSKLENFTATAIRLLFYLPARQLSSSRRLWLTCITQFSSSDLGIEKFATAFTAGERPQVALESDAASFEKATSVSCTISDRMVVVRIPRCDSRHGVLSISTRISLS